MNPRLLNIVDSLNEPSRLHILKTWANSATCMLIGMIAGSIRREKAGLTPAAEGGFADSKVPETAKTVTEGEVPTAEGYAELRDKAQDDDVTDHIMGGDTRLTMPLLVEWCAAIRGTAMTAAEGVEDRDRQYSQPMELEAAMKTMTTPRTDVDNELVEEIMEEEPTMKRDRLIERIRERQKRDAQRLMDVKDQVFARLVELLNDAPANREVDVIFADLPDDLKERLEAKAMDCLDTEVDRMLDLMFMRVPGIRAKRRLLKAGSTQLFNGLFPGGGTPKAPLLTKDKTEEKPALAKAANG